MTGIIVSIPPTVELPPGSSGSGPNALPGITYQYAVTSLPQTWTGVQTYNAGTLVLAGTGGTSQVLKQTNLNGTITVGQLAFSDISGTIANGQLGTTVVVGITNDTNIQGSISSQNLTFAWAGTLAVSRGGTGGGAASGTLLDNITGFSSTGFLQRTGAGTYAFSSATNGITNANLAQAAANTIKGNPTGSSANVQDFTIGSLTQKATPANTDLILIQDQASAGALKYATVSSLASSSVVASIAGNTGAFTLSTGLTNSTNDIRVEGSFSYRNRILNPTGAFTQAGLASTTNGNYTGFDQWLALTETAAVTPSQLTGVENGTPYMMRITQPQAAAQRFGLIQWIENLNSSDLRGQGLVLSARVRCSNSTTLRYAIIEWTGTADTITKNIVNNWASTTFTTGNFFTSTSTAVTATGSIALTANTLTNITALTGTVGSSQNNLAVFFWTDSQQAQNSTLDISRVQLEIGTSPTTFSWRPTAVELSLLQRYYQKVGFALEMPVTSGSDYGIGANFMCAMRITPNLSASDSSSTNLSTPTALSATGTTSYEYRKRASASGAGALISTITADARL